jgi:hypothetical protein
MVDGTLSSAVVFPDPPISDGKSFSFEGVTETEVTSEQ